MQDGLVDTVVLVPDLDARVAELYEARAVLSLNGGITSHGAVLARELELPCVVVSADTTCLDAMVGLEIEVDGWEGTISLPGVDRE
jgi:phosphohistidine swiveling domain-containing protein